MHPRSAVPLALAAACIAAPSSLHAQDAFHRYADSWRTLLMPQIGAGSFDVKADFLPDGRIVAVTGSTVFLETARGSADFAPAGILDAAAIGAGVDPSFLRVSPDGSTIAIGAGFNKPVAVFGVAALGTPGAPVPLTRGTAATYFNVPHYDAAWQSNSSLAITAGDFPSSFVSLLDVTSNPAAPANPVIITNIDGGTAGVAFDSLGRLYTGNGFDISPNGSTTGTIRAFDPALWSSGAADFENDGVFLGNILSAAALLFDRDGNLVVGGGNFPDDAGYLAVVHADAIANALAGFGPVDPLDPLQLRRLDPLGSGDGYFGAAYDPTTGELFATNGVTWYGTIPAPSAAVILGTLAFAVARRRRHA